MFSPRIGAAFQSEALAELDPRIPVSVYIHIPFCERLCWFCACHTQGTQTLAPVEGYIETLEAELALLRHILPRGLRMGQLHWGGGTPTILPPILIQRLARAIRDVFEPAEGFEFSVEIDPTMVDRAKIDALAAEGLVDAVDVFCETIGFTLAQTEQVFQAAQPLGLPVKLHAEQLSDMGGSALAARYGALSCDHIEHLSAEGIAAMLKAGTVAVLLPGAYFTLRDTHMPPIAALRAAGVPMAVSTDHNPGTSPALSLLLMLNMACTLFRLTVPEALAGVTRHAAQALGLQATHGQIAAGCSANFVLWPLGDVAELAYWLGQRPACSVVRQGRLAVDGMGLRRSVTGTSEACLPRTLCCPRGGRVMCCCLGTNKAC